MATEFKLKKKYVWQTLHDLIKNAIDASAGNSAPIAFRIISPNTEYNLLGATFPTGSMGSFTGIDGYHTFYGQAGKLTADLTNDNCWEVAVINVNIAELKLPVKYKVNLAVLVLGSLTPDETILIDLASYPNLGRVALNEGFNAGGYNSAGFRKRLPNYLITSNLIDFPGIGGLMVTGHNDLQGVDFQSSLLLIKPYANNYINLGSRSLTQVDIDFENFVFTSSEDVDGVRYNLTLAVASSPNLTNISLANLVIPSTPFENKYYISLNFGLNGLTTAAVNYILQYIDSSIPLSAAGGGTLGLGNSTDGTNSFIDSGSLVIGKNYVINLINPGDDFSNVGYVAPGVQFTATGDTPTNWSNYTEVIYGNTFGTPIELDFVSSTDPIPANAIIYFEGFKVTFDDNGDFISSEYLHTLFNGSGYVDQEIKISGSYFQTYPQNNPSQIVNPMPNAAEIVFKVTQIKRNAAPTGGTSNVNYQNLLTKGWGVTIAVS